jgi:hypothetical protein
MKDAITNSKTFLRNFNYTLMLYCSVFAYFIASTTQVLSQNTPPPGNSSSDLVDREAQPIAFRKLLDGSRYNFRLQIQSGNYNGPIFASSLQTAFDVLVGGPGSGWGITFSYDSNTFSLRIDVNNSNNKFWVMSDVEIANKLRGYWDIAVNGYGGNIDQTNPASMNDILRNYDNETKRYEQSTPFRSGFLNFQGINNMYLSSPNLGTFTTIGTRGKSTIIKKIPVSSDFGYMIIDRSVSVHDYLECGKCTLKTIEFHLRDSKGRYVPMHGSNISFSIVFAIKAED